VKLHLPIRARTSTLDLVFRLRDYQNKDLEKLYRLDQECFTPDIAYSRAELGSYIERKGAFSIIAELEQDWDPEHPPETEKSTPRRRFEKGTVAGFIVAELHPKGYGHIITIDTRQEFRRQDLGTTLLHAAEERLRKRDCFMVVLEVAVNNIGAITFYKRHGFSVVRTIPRYYNKELDAFFMSKRL